MSTERRQSVDYLTWGLCAVVVVQTVLFRLAPYYWLGQERDQFWHLIPMGALTLFAGAHLRSAWAVLVPLGAYLVADLLLILPLAAIGQPSFTWETPLVYASFAAYYAIGRLVPRDRLALNWVVLAALAGSTQFFLVTNFGSWLGGALPYTKDLAGLLDCYVKALPFHRNHLTADVVYGVGLFAAYAAAAWAVSPVARREEQPA
jgi:hypothetical protein